MSINQLSVKGGGFCSYYRLTALQATMYLRRGKAIVWRIRRTSTHLVEADLCALRYFHHNFILLLFF